MKVKAYDKNKLFEQAKKIVLENKNVVFIDWIVGFLPISIPTFYRYFPAGSAELNELKSLVDINKMINKTIIFEKLMQSGKAAELTAALRLIGNNEERKWLNQQYIENTVKSEQPIVLDIKLDGVEIKKNENNDGDGDNNENIENNEG